MRPASRTPAGRPRPATTPPADRYRPAAPPAIMPSVYRGSRTIVLAPKWLGDTIMALPVLETICESRPGGVDILAAEAMERLLKSTRLFRLILPTSDSFFENRRILKTAGYDEAFILPNSFRSALLPFLSGVAVRRAYTTDGRRLLVSEPVRTPSRDRHQVFDYDELLASTGLTRATRVPHFEVSPGFLEAGRQALRAAGVDPSATFVGLNPGGIGNPAKRWPNEHFGKLAAALRASGTTVVVYGGAADLDDARVIAAAVDPALPIIGPDEDCLGLAALLAPCRLLVTNDSGGMHLAAALGIPCVAMFGPTDPARTAPCGEGHRVIRGTTMASIPVEDVLRATESVLETLTPLEAPRLRAVE